MNSPMPCGLEDDRIHYEPEAEDTDPRTPMEQRLDWLYNEIAEAETNDTYDSWRDVRMMIYGATQALNFVSKDDRHKDRMELMRLSKQAFEQSQACIQLNKYEAAK